MTRTTLGRSRVRESRTLGSGGAKPNGLATRPDPSDESVATVSDSGMVTGVAAGTATITATYEELSDSVVITVK